MTECYKVPCLGLKEIFIDIRLKKISVRSDTPEEIYDIPLVPTTKQGVQKIFLDKENRVLGILKSVQCYVGIPLKQNSYI